MSERSISIKGSIHDLRKRYKNTTPHIVAKKKHGKLTKGYAHENIGLLELLCRRGCIGHALSKKDLNDKKNAELLLERRRN